MEYHDHPNTEETHHTKKNKIQYQTVNCNKLNEEFIFYHMIKCFLNVIFSSIIPLCSNFSPMKPLLHPYISLSTHTHTHTLNDTIIFAPNLYLSLSPLKSVSLVYSFKSVSKNQEKKITLLIKNVSPFISFM